MRETIGKLIVITVVMALSVGFFWLAVFAQVGGGSGPDTQSLPQVTATSCPAATPVANGATVLAKQSLVGSGGNPSISDRLCYTVTNYSTTIPVQVGEWISNTQGYTINPAGSAGQAGGTVTVCGTSEIDACGNGGSAVVGTVILRRQ